LLSCKVKKLLAFGIKARSRGYQSLKPIDQWRVQTNPDNFSFAPQKKCIYLQKSSVILPPRSPMHPKIDYFAGPWRSLCALILALAAGLPTAMAADYYLDDTEGLDTNAGTSPGAVYDIGDNRTQTLWIRDNEVPTITVTAPISSAAEGDGAGVTAGQYTFTASSAPSDDLTLSHAMADTSINGVDYS
jgi:hypothetical protein